MRLRISVLWRSQLTNGEIGLSSGLLKSQYHVSPITECHLCDSFIALELSCCLGSSSCLIFSMRFAAPCERGLHLIHGGFSAGIDVTGEALD